MMTHASMPKEVQDRVGITEGLVRLSVGIEDVEDIIADLDQALLYVENSTSSRVKRTPGVSSEKATKSHRDVSN